MGVSRWPGGGAAPGLGGVAESDSASGHIDVSERGRQEGVRGLELLDARGNERDSRTWGTEHGSRTRGVPVGTRREAVGGLARREGMQAGRRRLAGSFELTGGQVGRPVSCRRLGGRIRRRSRRHTPPRCLRRARVSGRACDGAVGRARARARLSQIPRADCTRLRGRAACMIA